MAVKVKLVKVVNKHKSMDPYKIEIPKRGYKWRIVEAEKGPSSKGNLMHTFDMELFGNKPILVRNPDTGENEEVDINGIQIRYWLTLIPKTLDRVNQFRSAHGMDKISVDKLESDNPNLYKGKVGMGIVIGKRVPQLDANEQPIINELTGKPMTQIDRKITDLMCPE